MDRLFFAIAVVESGMNPLAVGDHGSAVGILQIRPCVVEDCNEWLRRQGLPKRYTLESRWSVAASREMFYIYLKRWAEGRSDEVKARVWNGGPRGASKRATLKYWHKVRRILATHPACRGKEVLTRSVARGRRSSRAAVVLTESDTWRTS